MDTKQSRATYNRPEGDRTLDAPLVFFNLEEGLHHLRNEPAWQDNDRNALTIFKSPAASTVLIALHSGAEMTTMEPDNLMLMLVQEGKLFVTAGDQNLLLEKNGFLALHSGIPYTIKAADESVLLLTVVANEGQGEK